jgi:murein endopeptidase
MRLAFFGLLGALALVLALLGNSARPQAPASRAPWPTPPPASSVTPAPGKRAARLPPSRSLGLPWAGRLAHGRRLAARGPGYLTWDPILERVPDRGWRRWGSDRLVRTLRRVLSAFARRHRHASPVLVGDLSRPHGGDFGPRFGGIGHASHQNGLDADVYYPRRDHVRAPARRPEQVDRAAAQALVDAFVLAGAQRVFVGPSLGLRGPDGVVQALVHHDDHLHVRLAGRGA